jgi:hypothetical protein
VETRLISPEEQVRNIARALLAATADPGLRSGRKDGSRTTIERLGLMIERLLAGELEPLEVGPPH